MALLGRLCGAVLNLPLIITEPLLRRLAARRRVAAARRRSGTRPAPDSMPERVSRPGPSSADQKRMRDELRGVLDERPDARVTFRRLARFERKFSLAGLRALDQIPIQDLRRALVDFEALVSNWSSAPLAELRSRMAVTLSDRSSASSMWITAVSVASQYLPPSAAAARQPPSPAPAVAPAAPPVDIATVSMSRFEAAGGQWHVGERSGAPA
ncbi:MAG: hypothetical protein ABI641_13820 [Caldimonas sp.]